MHAQQNVIFNAALQQPGENTTPATAIQ